MKNPSNSLKHETACNVVQCLNLQQKNDMMRSQNERNNIWQIYMMEPSGQF